MHLAQALALEFGISDGEHFIDDQNFGFELRRHGEGEPYVHAGGVALYGCIEEPLHIGESNDLVEFAANLAAAHSQNGAVHEDILASGKVGMKSRSNLQEACKTAAHSYAPLRWF